MTRKEMKSRARKALRGHYGIFFVTCLVAAFLGTEFSNTLDILKARRSESVQQEAEEEIVPTGDTLQEITISDVIFEALQGDAEGSKEMSQQMQEKEIQDTKEKGNEVLGRSRGVFAEIVNAVTSGAFLIPVIAAMNSLIDSTKFVTILFILLALLLELGVWFLLCNVYTVVSRRIFLEGRTYEKVPMQRFAYLLRVKKWTQAAKTMGLTAVYEMLWDLTIVGGVIKHYSYFLVPYIVAENPGIPSQKAVKLSRDMMNGHKWECFVFEASYLGWRMLSTLTLGLLGAFYVNPYKVAAFSEYYAQLRSEALEKKLPGTEYLNDRYLYETADLALVLSTYKDSMEELQGVKEEKNPLEGFPGFLADVFSISVLGRAKEREFEAYQMRQVRYDMIDEIVEGRAYPARLFPISEAGKRKKVEHLRYVRCYSIWSLIILFFSFSFIGWIWEVSLHLVQDGVFVNRGVLHGPWLPIYGSGGVLILIFLNKFRDKPVLEFFTTVLLCGTIEYATSWFLEIMHDGQKWWDYSGYFLNLNGRICAEGLLVFGIGGIAIVYVVAPLIDNLVDKVSPKVLAPICLALVLTFAADQIYSSDHPNTGEGITDYTGAWMMGEMKKG